MNLLRLTVLCLAASLTPRATAQLRVLAVTSSANFAVGLLKPGGLASIFCTGIQDVTGVAAPADYPLPTALAGVRVAVNGTLAPLLVVANLAGGAYQQINIQIPWKLPDNSPLGFDVSQNGGAPAHFDLTGASSGWPAFFVDASGYAIAQHASDYRPVTRNDPAHPSEWIVVYATNLGPVVNQPADGYPADAHSLAPIVPDPSGYVLYYGLAVGSSGGVMATHIFSNYIGLLPGSVIYQANLLVPAFQPAGDLEFQLVDVYDCGFFFVQGCGRGLTTRASTMPAKLPIAN